MSLPIHSFAEAVGSQQVDSGLLEYAGAYAGEHVLASVLFQDQTAYTSAVQ